MILSTTSRWLKRLVDAPGPFVPIPVPTLEA
jgi:hypothetical protein